jgi:NADP-dependent 3-hydroxy acid dehydrogenase YdfG
VDSAWKSLVPLLSAATASLRLLEIQKSSRARLVNANNSWLLSSMSHERQAQSAVSAVFERFGQIDVLVNNAGRGLLGAVEEASAEEVRSVFAVNADGLLNVTRMVLPSMRARRSGRILNLSAVGGFDAEWRISFSSMGLLHPPLQKGGMRGIF